MKKNRLELESLEQRMLLSAVPLLAGAAAATTVVDTSLEQPLVEATPVNIVVPAEPVVTEPAEGATDASAQEAAPESDLATTGSDVASVRLAWMLPVEMPSFSNAKVCR